ncbi:MULTISPECIES: BadF/BadG/BcrA/BcrD ATPase family protein [unclassified Amycolatopsis]|uniref:N-acetylglucosamine kinase n=1 Tax=unclassified Amycolatopsis TaxID=2618356 RepID=UPI0028756100|nr:MULTISPECIES: BadF/BadG/BcrA/BcrD ATPase family protein [unclassified Amycolatopsis]MDS0133488.1 N-acetylglucosamine kinase [Amycolatopsis sp. 505]MDS0146718.1 N-acetylglucosamine kinase [Amycolatopsis sp. CM201R]
MSFAIGVDAGGTSTRAALVDATGAVLGTGRGEGANPNAHAPEVAAGRIADAITAALGGHDPGAVRACVVGMAGVSKLSDRGVAAVFDAAWTRIGLTCAVRTVADAEVAYASATSAPDGTVVVAGTGSIVGRIRKRRLAGTTGGYGWLLGDEGSAFWLGREAVRSTLEALGRGRPLDGLPSAVLAAALGLSALDVRDDAGRLAASRALITAANAEAPVRLARFAPLVSAAHDAGEPAAREIVARAAGHLAENALAAREPGESTPVVLVGSVLTGASPVGELVRRRLGELEVLTSSDGVLGAAWLAAVDAFGEGTPRPRA